MRSEDKEGSKKRRIRHGQQHPTQQSKANYQPDRVRCQLSRAKSVIIQNISDKFWNKKSKIRPKIFDVEGHLAWRWVIRPTIDPRDKKLKLLRDTKLLSEPFNIWFRKWRGLHIQTRLGFISRILRSIYPRRKSPGHENNSEEDKDFRRKDSKERQS